MLYGDIIFLAQNGVVKQLELYLDKNIPQMGGGYNKDDILCISGHHVDWEDVEEYGADINDYTKPTWA